MLGKKIKKIADKLPMKPFELAEQMGISTTTLYTFYKKDSIESKHLKKFSEISNVPLSELLELDSEIPKNNIIENDKDLLKENYSLAKRLADAENELKELYKKLFINRVDLDLGKDKASSKKATLSKEDLSLFSLNFGK